MATAAANSSLPSIKMFEVDVGCFRSEYNVLVGLNKVGRLSGGHSGSTSCGQTMLWHSGDSVIIKKKQIGQMVLNLFFIYLFVYIF